MPHLWLLFKMLKHPQSYKHHIERIVQDLSGYEPEVCLAMRLAPQESSRPPSPLSDEEGEHDDVEIDGFLSSHGFEFIDAIEKDGETLESDTWSSSEIPGIERVLDALSTVMWPSMTTTSKVDIQKRDREHALLDWAITSQDHSLSAVEKMTAKSGTQTAARTKAKKQEMEELARLLENYAFQDDPWKSAASTGGISMTPAVVDHYGKPAGATKVNSGFDDDFTVFVSAPAVDPIEVSGRSTPDIHTDGLSPAGPYAGHLYRTLGSASDLGGSEDGKDAEGNDTDDELPSKEEVLATFFGALQAMKAEIANMEDESERRRAAARVALGVVYGLGAVAE
ncbi:hypothetical protein C0993_006495 [Termitomyces sp. T159_Od127]|nr:hypothetical protein C0993_006495 [Termitomyces sp. T159_Od127]